MKQAGAPHGYKLANGELLINEEETEVIRIIYDRYIHARVLLGILQCPLCSKGMYGNTSTPHKKAAASAITITARTPRVLPVIAAISALNTICTE